MSLLDRIKKRAPEDARVGEDGVPTFNVTMLGGSGSGKTVFMHALFQLLRETDIEGHNIHGVGANVQEQLKRDSEIESFTWTRIMRSNRGKLTLPSGTADTQEWSFCLTHRHKAICRFNWIDYRGGLTENLQDDDPDTVSLRELIARSDGLIMFVNSAGLFYYEDDKDKKDLSGIGKLEQTIGSFVVQEKNNPSDNANSVSRKAVSIVLAKADSDLLDDRIARPGDIKGSGNNMLHRAYAGLTQTYLKFGKGLNQTLLDADWPTAITPVGAFGYGRTTTTLQSTEPESSLDDCLFEPENEAGVPIGNKRGVYFNPFNSPAQGVDYHAPSRSDYFPRPINAFSPVLWVLDNLLRDAKVGKLNVTEKQRGMFKDMVKSFRTQVFGDESSDELVEDPTTAEAVKRSIIVPLQKLYADGKVG